MKTNIYYYIKEKNKIYYFYFSLNMLKFYKKKFKKLLKT